MSKKPTLKPQQERAILALLTKGTQWSAAQEAEVSTRTIREWLTQPHFQEALQQAHRRSVDLAFAEIEGTAQQAVQTLKEVMGNVNAAPGTRVHAARTSLELAGRSRYLRSLYGSRDGDVEVEAPASLPPAGDSPSAC